jgi:hypothetical protein
MGVFSLAVHLPYKEVACIKPLEQPLKEVQLSREKKNCTSSIDYPSKLLPPTAAAPANIESPPNNTQGSPCCVTEPNPWFMMDV